MDPNPGTISAFPACSIPQRPHLPKFVSQPGRQPDGHCNSQERVRLARHEPGRRRPPPHLHPVPGPATRPDLAQSDGGFGSVWSLPVLLGRQIHCNDLRFQHWHHRIRPGALQVHPGPGRSSVHRMDLQILHSRPDHHHDERRPKPGTGSSHRSSRRIQHNAPDLHGPRAFITGKPLPRHYPIAPRVRSQLGGLHPGPAVRLQHGLQLQARGHPFRAALRKITPEFPD